MTYSVNIAFINEYSDSIRIKAEQKNSVFENLVTQGDSSGEYKFFDYIGAVTFTARTSSNETTVFQDVAHTKRVVSFVDYFVNFYKDSVTDLQRMKVDPQSAYVEAAVDAWNLKKDTIVVAAMFGTATTGKGVGEAFGSQVFDTTNQTVDRAYIVGDQVGTGNGSGTTTAQLAFSYDKFLAGRQILLTNHAIAPGEMPMMALDPEDESNLARIDQFRNRDYTAERLIADKMLDTSGLIGIWYGVALYRSTALPITDPGGANNQYRSLPMWVKSGIGMVKGGSPTVKAAENPSQNFAVTINIQGSCGVVRLEEKKIVEVRVATGTDPS